jgi:hypothetical protein
LPVLSMSTAASPTMSIQKPGISGAREGGDARGVAGMPAVAVLRG